MYPCPKCGYWTYIIEIKTDIIKCQQCGEIISGIDIEHFKEKLKQFSSKEQK